VSGTFLSMSGTFHPRMTPVPGGSFREALPVSSGMARRYANIPREQLVRAARFARLPGVKRTEACKRFDLSIGMLRRALDELSAESIPSREDLLLSALSDAGRVRSGELRPLRGLASWLDYVNKDGSTEADVEALLDALVRAGRLEVDGTRWTLVGEFP